MSSGISPSPLSRPMAASVHQFPSNLIIPLNLFSCPNPNSKFISFSGKRGPRTPSVRCNSSIFPRGPGSSGDGDSRSILDAFFLGKALAEAVNERIESTVGEVLSTVGRLQAEQQKQVQDFQEQVLERAKKAKEKAAREAMEAQGLISMSTAETRATGSAASVTSSSAADAVVPSSPSYSVQITAAAETDTEPTKTDAEPTKEEPALGSSKDD